MRQMIIVGFLSAGAFGAACTNTTVNTSGGSGAGSGHGEGGGATTSTKTTGGSGGQTTTTGTGTGTTTSHTTSSGGEGGATGYCAMPRSGEDCGSCPNGQLCGSCCITAVPNGVTAYFAYLYADCGCADSSPCHTQCSGVGDVCPGLQNPPSQTCSDCVSALQGSEACIVTFNSDCTNDQDCTLLNACLFSCP